MVINMYHVCIMHAIMHKSIFIFEPYNSKFQHVTSYIRMLKKAKEGNATIQPLHEYRTGFLFGFESDKEQQKANQLPKLLSVQEA